MNRIILCLAPLISLACASGVKAQACEGGLYLNPQIIKGESSAQSQGSVRDLIDFIRPSGLSISPVLNIKDVQDVVAAVKRPNPPCWVYGNPVTGLISGYRPVAVNTEPIQASVLVLADISPSKDGKPVELKSLPAPEQAAVLAKLKTAPCFGIKSGVTTELVKAEQLCGEVMEVGGPRGIQDIPSMPGPDIPGMENSMPLIMSFVYSLIILVLIVWTIRNFTFKLDQKQSPNNAASFVSLVQHGYFDKTVFHRIAVGFVIQGGGSREEGDGAVRVAEESAALARAGAGPRRAIRICRP